MRDTKQNYHIPIKNLRLYDTMSSYINIDDEVLIPYLVSSNLQTNMKAPVNSAILALKSSNNKIHIDNALRILCYCNTQVVFKAISDCLQNNSVIFDDAEVITEFLKIIKYIEDKIIYLTQESYIESEDCNKIIDPIKQFLTSEDSLPERIKNIYIEIYATFFKKIMTKEDIIDHICDEDFNGNGFFIYDEEALDYVYNNCKTIKHNYDKYLFLNQIKDLIYKEQIIYALSSQVETSKISSSILSNQDLNIRSKALSYLTQASLNLLEPCKSNIIDSILGSTPDTIERECHRVESHAVMLKQWKNTTNEDINILLDVMNKENQIPIEYLKNVITFIKIPNETISAESIRQLTHSVLGHADKLERNLSLYIKDEVLDVGMRAIFEKGNQAINKQHCIAV